MRHVAPGDFFPDQNKRYGPVDGKLRRNNIDAQETQIYR